MPCRRRGVRVMRKGISSELTIEGGEYAGISSAQVRYHIWNGWGLFLVPGGVLDGLLCLAQRPRQPLLRVPQLLPAPRRLRARLDHLLHQTLPPPLPLHRALKRALQRVRPRRLAILASLAARHGIFERGESLLELGVVRAGLGEIARCVTALVFAARRAAALAVGPSRGGPSGRRAIAAAA